MRASLADQDHRRIERLAAAVSQVLVRPGTIAIALGANLPSSAGGPADTLLAVRPLLEATLQHWQAGGNELRFRWSPLIQTRPVGGPAGQADYINGALLVELPLVDLPSEKIATEALQLLAGLQRLESRFGRPAPAARQPWGPRSLDLDWLWWGELELDLAATAATPALRLPHPLWRQREFVLAPLQAIAGSSGGSNGGSSGGLTQGATRSA